MSETIGTILVDEGKITLKPFEGEEETWEESKSLINTISPDSGHFTHRFSGDSFLLKIDLSTRAVCD